MLRTSTRAAVGIVGLGRMGQTLAAGFNRAVPSGRLFAVGRSRTSVVQLRSEVPGAGIVSLPELPDRADLLVLCVRNADLPAVLTDLRPRLTADHVVIVLNNGISLTSLAEAVPGPVAKLIPSVGNEIGVGATLLVPGPGFTEENEASVLSLLRSFSVPFVIEEHQGRAATDLASCGPALLARMAAEMADAQIKRNAPLSADLAESLVATSLNALSRLLDNGASAAEIVDRVAVPGGNTAAAIEAAEHHLAAAWHAAFQTTADNERSKPPPQLNNDEHAG